MHSTRPTRGAARCRERGLRRQDPPAVYERTPANPVVYASPMVLDASRIGGWIEPLGKRTGEIAEVFAESRTETVLELEDGEIRRVRSGRISGVSARWALGGRESLCFVPREIGRAHV